jgi:hypothetical protein
MRASIELTAIDTDAERTAYANAAVAAQTTNDLEQPTTPTPFTTPDSATFPVTVYVDEIREYYPRHGGKPGTRITYTNGAGRPVRETYDEVKSKLTSLMN